MTSDKKSVLYVALDESNHGRFPEVCVAIFSIIPEDAYKHEFFSKGDLHLLCQLPSANRDYRFLFLDEHQLKPSQSNLTLVAPSLILPYLQSLTGGFDVMNIYLDGRLNKPERDHLDHSFERHVSKVHARGFIKRWKRADCDCSRSYIQPYLLGVADAKAHSLYEEYNLASAPNIKKISHDKLVQLL
ncbi:MAG: hypothetical protein WC979_03540 [Candidatus Pacearchaeota archaeon]|jgi:hypothetical protein